VPTTPWEGNSAAALEAAQLAVTRDPRVLGAPVIVELGTVEDVRELAYIVREIHWASSVGEATLRLARWLRHREVPPLPPLD
jgi:hypothetical protein